MKPTNMKETITTHNIRDKNLLLPISYPAKKLNSLQLFMQNLADVAKSQYICRVAIQAEVRKTQRTDSGYI